MSAPKPLDEEGNSTRTNRKPLVHQVGILRWDGVRRGPELKGNYCDETIEWWETWRTSPQAMVFEATDWEELKIAAKIHNRIFGKYMKVDDAGFFNELEATTSEIKALAGELRQRVEKWGATVKDRDSLRMKIQPSEKDISNAAEEIAKSAASIDYRSILQRGPDNPSDED